MTVAEQQRLKQLVKKAFIEVLQERPDLLRKPIMEAIEDAGLLRAMKSGLHSPAVNRQKIFQTLKRP